MRTAIPPELRRRPFTVARAAELGVSRKVLLGPQFVRLHRGVYAHQELDLSMECG